MRQLKKALADLDADATTRLVSLASDIAVVLDRDGIVRDLAIANASLSKESDAKSWIGRPWIDTVTVESRPKIEQLLRDGVARKGQPVLWRQVNHPVASGQADLPVRYATMPLGKSCTLIAIGRELKSLAVMQQRLVESQQAMEREYARLRFAETRYRLLFQVSSEAVLILDATTLRVVEINPAAQRLIGSGKRIQGRAFNDLFDGSTQGAVIRLLNGLRSAGKADPAVGKLAGSQTELLMSGSLFKQEGGAHLLIQLASVDERKAVDKTEAEGVLKTLVERMPDAFVVTDLDWRILTANPAFLDLAQQATPDLVKGQSLGRWLGRSPAELTMLAGELTQHGSVRRFPTLIQGELGASEEVEVSAVHVAHGDQTCFGLSMRSVGPRAAPERVSSAQLPHSTSQLTRLVGQVPLKNLVRDTTDLIERMCIEAALEVVGNNRASAAELLGLSRQSLYMKLRRYGIGEAEGE